MSTDAYSDPGDQPIDEPVYIESADHLETVVADHDVVLVDFFATWCGPCQMLDPILRGLASDTDAVIAKVDVDDHQLLAGEYGVRGVPTLLLFADGEQVEQHVGALPADQLRRLIEGYTTE
ncbi:thioredoxin [Natrononativus amylolyticus]|uniref:thioredoxin n=1 Tax=Natrononativus amylolyticus TaxID=2963434 RepID=UPI0020CEB432|nr:thioredoxin [Natrononativus amylolyticus]